MARSPLSPAGTEADMSAAGELAPKRARDVQPMPTLHDPVEAGIVEAGIVEAGINQTLAPARRILPAGAIDVLDDRQISGWAWYPPMPNEPIDIEVLVDDLVVLTVRADLPRASLAEAGAGNGDHGFHVPDLRPHLPPGPHLVRVRRARDRLDLPGSRQSVIGAGTIETPPPAPTPEAPTPEEPPPWNPPPGNPPPGNPPPGEPPPGEPPTVAPADQDEVVVSLAGTPIAQPDPAPRRPAMAIGAIETLDDRQIIGWAWYPPMPNEPIDIEILVDDIVVLTRRAGNARPDLAATGAGDGQHGFHIDDLATFIPPGSHVVRVRRARDRLDLPGSRQTVTGDGRAYVPPVPMLATEPVLAPVTPAGPIGNLDRLSHQEISGWAWDPAHPGLSVDIEILDGDEVVLRVTADQFRPDLIDAGMAGGTGDGRHGFAIHGLDAIFPLSRHRVRVRRASDGRDLPKSPAWITRAGLSEQAVDFTQNAILSAIQAASKADDLSQPLAHLLTLLNEVVNAHESLAHGSDSAPIEAASAMQLTGRTRELVEQLRYAYEPLRFAPSDQPEVSIIIPVHNKFSHTYDCLKSITECPPERSFEIIIVDDCSDDETILASLLFTGAVRILRNTTNLMFVKTCNAGAALARGKYLFFLNNDTLVRDGWLDELVETFENVPNIGIAGSRLLFADGSLQEAGGIVWRLGDGWNHGRNRDPEDPAFSYLRDADWVSGAALMIERSMFEDLGGFDELFAPAYYEDTDLAFRVRAKGRRVVMQPASTIVHLEGVSAGTDTTGSGMKRFQVVNHAKFYRRWKDTLLAHRFNGDMPEREAERLVRKRAYFIDDSVPTPDKDAGSNAAFDHIRTLIDLGYKVTFLPADNMAKIEPYTGNLQKIGVECLHHPFFWSVEEVFRKAPQKPDLVYLHRYTNASKYATMVRRYFPDCRIVYSVADLHFLRMERQAAIDPGSVSPSDIARQRHDEMAAMRHVDSVIVHSPVEAAMLHDVDPAMNVRIVPWSVQPRPPVLSFTERYGMAFVGGFGHPPNVDAVRHFLDDILPLLRPLLPDLTMNLVGSNLPAAFSNLNVPGVIPVGYVRELADIMARLRCTVVPLRYGAGIKGKVLESFAHGLPCVMSEVAAEGLDLPEDLAWLVARSPAEFAEKLARVHEDATFNRRLAEAGLAYITRGHGQAFVREALRAAVAG